MHAAGWRGKALAGLAAALLAVGGASGQTGEVPQTQPQTQPQTRPQTAPRTPGAGGRKAFMLQRMKEMGIDPNHQRVRYEKGSFMITGSIEIARHLYDDRPVVEEWIRQIGEIWKKHLPPAAKMGNPGRVTFRGNLVREGIKKLEKIEPSGLDSLDEAATQALEEFKPNFKMPEDFPQNYLIFYLKFHYNIFSEL
jgi:hypothetical protein